MRTYLILDQQILQSNWSNAGTLNLIEYLYLLIEYLQIFNRLPVIFPSRQNTIVLPYYDLNLLDTDD